MKIILVGCVKSSELFLKKLLEIKTDIVGVITKEKSYFNSDFVDLGIICKENNIDFMYTKDINDKTAKNYLYKKNPDLILCLGWSQLLDKEVLDIPKMGCIGFHPAELPYNKGRHPLIWALVLGLERTASTLFFMDSTADTGRIISQEYVDIEYTDDAGTLYHKVMQVAVKQLERTLYNFPEHELEHISKMEPSAKTGNTWRKRGVGDGVIDWRMSSRGIYNLVRGLTKPYVGAHFNYQGQAYKVWKVKEIITDKYKNIEFGKVLKVMSSTHFIVRTGDNLIEVLECDSVGVKEGEYL